MDYITCHRKKSFPKVPVDLCTQCSRRKTCRDYDRYIQPPLFPDFYPGAPGRSGRRRKRSEP